MSKPKAGKRADAKPWKFEELIAHEFQRLRPPEDLQTAPGPNPEDFNVREPGAADEPWVIFTRRDHFGIALSGGGIRSATFNLGLLQALDRNEILQHVDYLSTVSGGGYVGGFWTAWLHRQWQQLKAGQFSKALGQETVDRLVRERRVPTIFPRQDDTAPDQNKLAAVEAGTPRRENTDNARSPRCDSETFIETREPGEIRHLREFSRFLMPRVGFAQMETWSGLITILGGLLPALLGATALVILGIYFWLGLNYLLLEWDVLSMVVLMIVGTGLVQAAGEWAWREGRKAGDAREQARIATTVLIVVVALVSGAAWWFWRTKLVPQNLQFARWLHFWHGQLPAPGRPFTVSPLLFGPAIAWSVATLAMVGVRFLSSRFISQEKAMLITAAMDRCACRCLAPAVVWAGAAACWELCRFLYGHGIDTTKSSGGAVVFGGLFLWLRNWLLAPQQETRGTKLLDKLLSTLKPLMPQLLAFACVVSFCIAMTVLVQSEGLFWRTARVVGPACAVYLLGMLVCFNPAVIGMHDFYRGRIARCFLGAARQRDATQNRPTFEQKTDDLPLCDEPVDETTKLEASQRSERYPGRPIHLVCCAANNLAGDTLSSLYRGCRSAVLSPHGISLGAHTARLEQLRFSSALTASAAAFNSQMGRISMRLGPAVALIMGALNLRLGLWAPHPLNLSRRQASLPGRFFLYEMFGFTRCDQDEDQLLKHHCRAKDQEIHRLTRLKEQLLCSKHVHLSDGGHFENLALYELIRRRCRYIIVSDCGADPGIRFDDLANALRCVREDFGVEIELDVSPLRPGPDNQSTQHAVVGTIHYDGLNGNDKGTLLYFKPTLTGDEPPDVLQYHTRNQAFPHESTGDQFYDEAQWESYRRLGEHAANLVLGFVQTKSYKQASAVENLFLAASQRWHPAPERQDEIFLQLTERCAELEAEVRDHAPLELRLEFFPEIAAAGLANSRAAESPDQTQVIYFVMLAAQVMEDAWLSAQLETYWSHPLNQGWMAYFERWASTPSFRRWWPVVRSLFSPGFADFVKDRFNLRLHDYEGRPEKAGTGAELKLSDVPLGPSANISGLAWEQWLSRHGEPDRGDHKLFTYNLTLDARACAATAQQSRPVQVGFLLFKQPALERVEWTTPHLFVPASLVGAGIQARFLDVVITRFKAEGVREIYVTLEEQTGDSRSGFTADPQNDKDPKIEARKGFRRDQASRYQRVHTINFYKSRGFVYLRPGQDGQLRRLFLDLTKPLATPPLRGQAPLAQATKVGI